jgi:hypothetical protein
MESGGFICVGVFGSDLDYVAVKMISRLIYIIMTFYKFCTLDAICKDNDTMNGDTVQHKRFIPTNFDWSYYASTTIILSRVSSGSIVTD